MKRLIDLGRELGNVQQACVELGFNRTTYYKWAKRYDELEVAAEAEISLSDEKLLLKRALLGDASRMIGDQEVSLKVFSRILKKASVQRLAELQVKVPDGHPLRAHGETLGSVFQSSPLKSHRGRYSDASEPFDTVYVGHDFLFSEYQNRRFYCTYVIDEYSLYTEISVSSLRTVPDRFLLGRFLAKRPFGKRTKVVYKYDYRDYIEDSGASTTFREGSGAYFIFWYTLEAEFKRFLKTRSRRFISLDEFNLWFSNYNLEKRFYEPMYGRSYSECLSLRLVQ